MSIYKIFVNNTSLFSEVKDKICSTVELNNDLKILSNWAIEWKMLFNSDPNKQTVEIVFPKKTLKRQLSTTDF